MSGVQRSAWLAFATALCFAPPGFASEKSFAQRPEIAAFINEMAEKHQFERKALEKIFSQARFRSDVIEAISRPAAATPWHEYRSLFINPRRITGGVRFWDRHSAALARASQDYGVPEEIIVAVIGVETLYGERTGAYRVLDALTTLAFDYPKRADFFRSELEQYLLLARERGTDPLSMKGSYAGAMGIPQFMPSSYRLYAVDFDGDGDTDVWRNAGDAIGSVANYLKVFGWESGQPLAMRAQVAGDAYRALLDEEIKPHKSVEELKKLGVTPLGNVAGERQAALIELETLEGPEYWLGFNNFYVITRYNRSTYYAMAVAELAWEIKSLRWKDGDR